jgi:hypothetical protein
MDVFAPDLCYYDDPDLPKDGDADASSPLLRKSHRKLWSKQLRPGGEILELTADLTVTSPESLRGVQLSSDTIANTHRRYVRHQIDIFWGALTLADQRRYDRGFYTIGGFIVFPCHPSSMNQNRGTRGQIADRFDLTLECIRLYYEGITAIDRNPLGDVLLADSAFFDLFGQGIQGFNAYVEFFYLGDLIADGRIRWFDDFDGGAWSFVASPLPKTQDAYVRYLENVLNFVDRRNKTIATAMKGHQVNDAIDNTQTSIAPG